MDSLSQQYSFIKFDDLDVSLLDLDKDSGVNSGSNSGSSTPSIVSDESTFNFKNVKVEEPKAKNFPVQWTLYYADEPEAAPMPEKTLRERIISVLLKPFTFIRDLIFGKKTETVQQQGWACADITTEAAKASMPKFSSQDRVDQYVRPKMSDLPLKVKDNDFPTITATDEHGTERVKEDFRIDNPAMSAEEVQLRKELLNQHYAKLEAAEAKRQEVQDKRNQKKSFKDAVVSHNKQVIAEASAEGIEEVKLKAEDKQARAEANRARLMEEKQLKLKEAKEKRTMAKERAEKFRAENPNAGVHNEIQILLANQKKANEKIIRLEEKLQERDAQLATMAEKLQPRRGILEFLRLR